MLIDKPIYLLLLLIIPFLYLYNRKKKHLTYSLVFLLPKKKIYRFLREIPLILLLLILFFQIIGISRPRKGVEKEEIETKGIDIVITLDISGSMLSEDFKPQNRVTVAKDVAKDFVMKRTGDRIGLVVFANGALMQCPLTIDRNIIIKMIKDVNVGLLPDGTAIGMGIATSLILFENSEAKEKVIILITDGINNAGKITPLEATSMAKKMGIKIYTIGIGKKGEVPYPVYQGGIKRYVMTNFEINDSELSEIAYSTGGKYFAATDENMLKDVMETINKLEPTTFKVIKYKSYYERFNLFLIPAIILFIFYFLEPLITWRLT